MTDVLPNRFSFFSLAPATFTVPLNPTSLDADFEEHPDVASCSPRMNGVPGYTPSRDVPAYTHVPRPDEVVLLARRRRRHHEVPFVGQSYIVKDKLGTVELLDQMPVDKSGRLPTYGRAARIRGAIRLADDSKTATVLNVSIALKGCVRVIGQLGGAEKSETFLDLTHALSPRESPTDEGRPAYHFDFPIPSTIPNASDTATPPSFETTGSTVIYMLVVSIVTKRRGFRVSDKTTSLTVPIKYLPTIRAQVPPLPQDATLPGTIKLAPDEWTSVSMHVEATPLMRKYARFTGLDAEIAFPASRTFAPGERIPLHIQLTGDAPGVAALRASFKRHHVGTIRHKTCPPDCNHSRCKATQVLLESAPAYSESSSSQALPPLPPGTVLSPPTSYAALARTMSRRSRTSLGAGSTSSLVSSTPLPEFELSLRVTLERRTVSTDICNRKHLQRRVLASATIWRAAIAGSAAEDGDWLALDGAIIVPETDSSTATVTTGFRVGPLVVCDAIVLSVVPGKIAPPYKTAERAVPVALVSEAFDADDTEPYGHL